MPKLQKGQTNNPNGRPKRSKSMQFGLRSALDAKFGSFDDGIFKIADELVAIATDKNHPKQLAAIQEITDRLDGKPAQAIIGDKDEDPVQVSVSMADKEIIERYIKQRAKND
jgi:hypothetical protein